MSNSWLIRKECGQLQGFSVKRCWYNVVFCPTGGLWHRADVSSGFLSGRTVQRSFQRRSLAGGDHGGVRSDWLCPLLSLLIDSCLALSDDPSIFLCRSLEESVCKPVCLIFRNLVTMQEDNSGFSVLLDMLAELYQKQPKIGYHLLYYLKARWAGVTKKLLSQMLIGETWLNSMSVSVNSKAANGKMMLYESFAQATALGDLHTCLMMDMKACQEDDVRLLCYLTPSIYSEVGLPKSYMHHKKCLKMRPARKSSHSRSTDLRASFQELIFSLHVL